METYILKVRRRILHYIRILIVLFFGFLFFLALAIDITLNILFHGAFSIFLILYLIIAIIGVSISFFIFPRYVIMEYGQIRMVYVFRKKVFNYTDIEWFGIDDLMKTVKLKITGIKSPIDFFYSDDDLEGIRSTFGRYRVKRRFKGDEKRKN